MNTQTTTQLTNEVLQFCIDNPAKRNYVFARVGKPSGVFGVVSLWLAVQECKGSRLATVALDALLEMD